VEQLVKVMLAVVVTVMQVELLRVVAVVVVDF
jgi:hypothetical protein